ncbi:MAG: PAS domain S-box protein [Gammaproteobacteria bacterium]|nr:PAS domain S-box protein [Gammaproteobacteria bacterium]
MTDEMMGEESGIAAERALRTEDIDSDTLANMALVAQHTTNAAIIADGQGHILWVNAGFEKMSGYRLAELVGKKPGEILQGPETDPATVAVMAKAVAKEQGFHVETINYTKSGQPYWCDVRMTPVRGDSGSIEKYVAIESDITEQKLRTLDFQGQIDAIRKSQLVAEFTLDGALLSANDRFSEVLGYGQDALDGLGYAYFVGPDSAASDEYMALWEGLRRGEAQNGEFLLQHQSGADIWLQATYTPVLLAKGKVEKVLMVAADITEMITHRNQLHANESRIRAILETVVDGIITIDGHGLIESFNPAAERLFGYETSEVIGRNVKMLMPEPYSSNHDTYLSNYRNGGKAKIIGIGREVVGRRKDGSTFHLELAVGEMDILGRRLYTGIVRDISEQRRNAVKLDSLNREMSLKLEQLAELNEVNNLLNEMGTFFQLSQTLEELFKVVRKYCHKLFNLEAGAFYHIINNTLLEQGLNWGEPQGSHDFHHNDCWSLRRGEAYTIGDTDEDLVCNHLGEALESDGLDYALCIPVIAQEGTVGLLSIYGRRGEKPLLGLEREARLNRNRHILIDIADRFGTAMSNIKLREKLRSDSTIDPLTKLYNRRFFEEASALELRRSTRADKPLSLLMVDADHFKSFNDEYGHDAGDFVLSTLANTLRESSRGEDIPTRLGGEEFALLLSMGDEAFAKQKAEQIRQTVEALELRFNDVPLRRITLSIGTATIPTDATTIADALTIADKALYQAKESGRNRVVAASQLK